SDLATLPQRARELIGFSIHPPFMGYVDGVHPEKALRMETKHA
ncbi:MAG TPA: phytanoyl-CoA dioxygenase, partial [Rhodobiaceae bacterium]|nr:phytanoyl-CoA dioxygenase [Rhodobiaceae bacterium]